MYNHKLTGKFEGRETDLLLSALPVLSLDRYWKPACILHSCLLPSLSPLTWIIFIASAVSRLWSFLSCSILWATARDGSAFFLMKSHQVHAYPDFLSTTQEAVPFTGRPSLSGWGLCSNYPEISCLSSLLRMTSSVSLLPDNCLLIF